MTLTEKRFFEWEEDEIAVTLRASGASYGGGSEVLVISECCRDAECDGLQGATIPVCEREQADSGG